MDCLSMLNTELSQKVAVGISLSVKKRTPRVLVIISSAKYGLSRYC